MGRIRTLRLEILELGDVILETGLACADKHWGHASLAMGKLFWIEAGKPEGVELTALLLTVDRHGGLVRRPLD